MSTLRISKARNLRLVRHTLEPVDFRGSRMEAAVHSREASLHDRKMDPSPRSFAGSRSLMDRGRISPDAREPHHLPPHESASRHARLPPYGHVKAEPTERLPYPAEVTPLHEARGLLPIRPIPVDSKLADLPCVAAARTVKKH